MAKTHTDVVASDIDQDCLNHINEFLSDLRIETEQVSGVSLARYDDESFSAITIARALYLEPQWRLWLKNIHRVLSPKGRLGHRWSLGEPGDLVFDMHCKAIELSNGERGGPGDYYLGTLSKAEVDEELSSLGFIPRGTVDAEPSPEQTVGRFIDRMEDGTGVSWLKLMEKSLATEIATALREFAVNRTGSLDLPIRHYSNNDWDIWEKSSDQWCP